MADLQREIGAVFDIDDDDSVKDWLRLRSKRVPNVKQSGMPSKVSKVRAADKALKALGLRFNFMTRMEPEEWEQYKKNKNLGAMLGHSLNGHLMRMLNVTEERWKQYKLYGKVFVYCVGIQKMDNGKKAVLVVEHDGHQNMATKFFREQADIARNRRSLQEPEFGQDKPFRGPSGSLVSRNKFKELTLGGCGYCADTLELEDHADLHWVGDTAICKTCTNDPEFWTYIHENPKDFLASRMH
jgi:hypothetical protein